ncbi:MAG: HAMP domain-containing sensor histidine kinase [Alphaproteobacteria bacterium]
MIRPLRSLVGKLMLTMAVLLALNGAAFAVLALLFARHHLQTVEQSVEGGLAARILAEGWLPPAGDGNAPVEMAFDRLMSVNAAIEIYRLDAAGRILAFSAPAGRVVRDRVDLAPIAAFLDGSQAYPILGDDPRSADGRKVFSAAAIAGPAGPDGYLYVVLGGEAYQSIARMLEDDYVLQLTVAMTAAAAALTLLMGAVAFLLITRRFRRLSAEMRRFGDDRFRRAPASARAPAAARRDEIDALAETFREMADMISAQIAMLERADEARRTMVANISHDLRTPLATLRGFLETLMIKGTALDPATRQRYLALASDYAVRLTDRIGELFELSSLEAPSPRLAMQPFSIAELAQDMAGKLADTAGRRGIRFTADIARDTPFVVGDIGLIERVFEKLIENAFRFTPAGGRVTVTVAHAGDSVYAQVEDSGPGIAAADLPHIFDRHYQGDPGRGALGEGAGLGLAIAKRIVALHRGRIGALDRTGGATVYFELPAAPMA